MNPTKPTELENAPNGGETSGVCPTCAGTGGYYENTIGDGGAPEFLACEDCGESEAETAVSAPPLEVNFNEPFQFLLRFVEHLEFLGFWIYRKSVTNHLTYSEDIVSGSELPNFFNSFLEAEAERNRRRWLVIDSLREGGKTFDKLQELTNFVGENDLALTLNYLRNNEFNGWRVYFNETTGIYYSTVTRPPAGFLPKTTFCDYCGTDLANYPAAFENGNQFYCSVGCKALGLSFDQKTVVEDCSEQTIKEQLKTSIVEGLKLNDTPENKFGEIQISELFQQLQKNFPQFGFNSEDEQLLRQAIKELDAERRIFWNVAFDYINLDLACHLPAEDSPANQFLEEAEENGSFCFDCGVELSGNFGPEEKPLCEPCESGEPCELGADSQRILSVVPRVGGVSKAQIESLVTLPPARLEAALEHLSTNAVGGRFVYEFDELYFSETIEERKSKRAAEEEAEGRAMAIQEGAEFKPAPTAAERGKVTSADVAKIKGEKKLTDEK